MSQNNFKLTLDTLAPVGKLTYPTSLATVKNYIDITMEIGDATYMQVWYDTAQNTASAPANTP